MNEQKQRSIQQNKYYWGVIIAESVQFYTENPVAFINDIFGALGVSLPEMLKEAIGKLFRIVSVSPSADMVHSLFKMRFNKQKSTTDNNTVNAEEFHSIIREYFFHEYNFDIPPPNQPPLSTIMEQNNVFPE